MRPPTRLLPLALLSLAMLSIAAIVGPWGNYPVNDDWQYARIVKHLSETGRFFVDVDVAPSLVGQIWLSLPLVKILGFSHTALRVETMVVAVVLLWLVDRLVHMAGVTPGIRALVAILLLVNPIFLHVAFSYMTEVYGYALALSGAVVWLHRRPAAGRDGPLVAWRDGLIAATLIGASFWIRQFSVAVFPALALATVVRSLAYRERVALRRTVPVIAAATLWVAILVVAYFAWAKLSGNYRPAFGGQIRALVRPDIHLMVISAFEIAAYLTLFLFPFLLLERWRSTRWGLFLALAAAGAAWILAAQSLQPQHAAFHHHVRFPFSANVVNDTAVGPLTLTTTYWDPAGPRPRWPPRAWIVVEGLVVCGMLLWPRLAAGPREERTLSPVAAEIREFGAFFAALSFALYMQAYHWEALDRYFFPCVLGGVITLAARTARPGRVGRNSRIYLALAAAAPLAWFTIAGVHDYFRWNDARWTAVGIAEANGASPQTLDGGYEVNGWLNYDGATSGVKPSGCIGLCRCRPMSFFCTDDSYMISFGLPADRTQIAELPVSWWLAKGPTIVVSRRRP